MALVRIPSLLRDISGGRSEVEVQGRNLRQVVDALDAQCPGIKARLMEDGSLRPELAFAVDGETAELGLLEPVGERSEVLILPALSGG
jgi:molybdopterin converting factor small subunit